MISKILFYIKFHIRRERLIWANWKARNERPQPQPVKRNPKAKATWQDSLNQLKSI